MKIKATQSNNNIILKQKEHWLTLELTGLNWVEKFNTDISN